MNGCVFRYAEISVLTMTSVSVATRKWRVALTKFRSRDHRAFAELCACVLSLSLFSRLSLALTVSIEGDTFNRNHAALTNRLTTFS